MQPHLQCKHHPPTSPNAAPATKNDTPHSLSWHMQRHLQCAKQQASAANITKYCPCHARWLSWLIFLTYETSFTMRGGTDLILQHHRMLRLPRKMTRIIYPRDIWNVISNARSNKHHPPTSPNTAPATQNDSHDWCPSHMTCHLQCAEQQISSSNITKCCACHAKWLASSILVTYETSFTMRGATCITFQPHQMLPLPRKMMRIIDCRDICNVIYNARSNRHHPPTSPNTAPATQNYIPKSKKNLPKTADASIPMRGRSEHDPNMNSSSRTRPFAEVTFHASETHFALKITTFRAPAIYPNFTKYCACHEKWQSDITKYCACPEKWYASLIVVTYATSFTMRGATGITLQPHQMLRLPRKKRLVLGPRLIWNVIYNAQSNRSHPPTSPSAAPATQNDSHHLSSWHMKRHLQCAEQHASPSNLTKCCPCHEKWCASLIAVTYATSFTMRGATDITLRPHQILRLPRKITLQNQRKICRKQLTRQFQCGDDPNMIRPWTRHLAPARSPRLLFTLRRRILYWKLQHFALRLSIQISPNTAPATKSDTPTSPNTAPATKSDTPTSPNAAPATKSDTPTSPNTAPAMKSDTELLLDCTLTCYLNWIVSLLSCYLTELSEQLLHCCYLTELLLDWAVTSLLLLYWAVTLLSGYFTEVLLSWAVTLLSCYFTELLLDWSVTSLLFLDWAVTLLSCYFAELLLSWAVNLLSCYFTELLLHWAVTLLSCFFTELLLYWAVTFLSC